MKKIMIVDDDPIYLDIVLRVLYEADFRVYVATNSLDAKKINMQINLDLIVVDFNLGNENATDVVNALGRKQNYVFCSSYLETEKALFGLPRTIQFKPNNQTTLFQMLDSVNTQRL